MANVNKIFLLICNNFVTIKRNIYGLTGSGLRTELVAPRWIGKELDCLNKIDRELERRNSRQGIKFEL